MGQERSLDVGVGGVKRCEDFVGLRLGNHRSLQRARGDCARGNDFAQARQNFSVEERLALVRWTGQKRDELAVAFEGGVEPLAGCAAVGILQKRCALQDIGLLEIVLRHGDAPACGAGVEGGDLRGVAAEIDGERVGGGFAGEVVFSGA